METSKFTAKQLLVFLGVNVLGGLIVSLVVYHLTKPKDSTTSTTSPQAMKQQTTQPASASTVTASAPVSEGN